MKLWLISQTVNDGYDTYDSAVVAAETEDRARLIHPGGYDNWDGKAESWSDWASADNVRVELIGEATPGLRGVICASFNAG